MLFISDMSERQAGGRRREMRHGNRSVFPKKEWYTMQIGLQQGHDAQHPSQQQLRARTALRRRGRVGNWFVNSNH